MMVCSIGSVMLCVSLLVIDVDEDDQVTSVSQTGNDISSREGVKRTKNKNEDPFNNLAGSSSAIQQLRVKVEDTEASLEDKIQHTKTKNVFIQDLQPIAIELPLEIDDSSTQTSEGIVKSGDKTSDGTDDSSRQTSEDLAIQLPLEKSDDISVQNSTMKLPPAMSFGVIVNIEPHNSSNTLGKTARLLEMLKERASPVDMHHKDRCVEGMLLPGRGRSQYSLRNLQV